MSGALALVVVLFTPVSASAELGDCSQPSSSGAIPKVSDCLVILRAAVGLGACTPECICAPKGSLPVVAADALVCLRKAVGQDVALDCPCTTLSTTSTTLPTMPSPAQLIDAIDQPQRLLSVESFTDNNNFPVFADVVFPELQALRAHGPEAVDELDGLLEDQSRDASGQGDGLRALAALALEGIGNVSAVTALRNYLERVLLQTDPVPFYSCQAGAHALAALTGQHALVLGLYGVDDVQAVLDGANGFVARAALSPPRHSHVLPSSTGNPIGHEHLIGPVKPPAWFTADFSPAERQTRDDVVLQKLDGFAQFDDPITFLETATRSYDCHSFTFRRGHNHLDDVSERYHILGEAVEGILADEGYTKITATPEKWRAGDVVVFYAKAGGTPTHTGRLSQIGTSLSDPNLRFTSKWSVTLPVIDVSVRDCAKLYGSIVEVWGRPPLYGASDTALFTLEKETGFASLVGTFGIPQDQAMLALASLPSGQLYGITFGLDANLYRIDTLTGAATAVGALGVGFVFEGGLSYDSPSGQLIGVNVGDASAAQAFRIDPLTGSGTVIGPTPAEPRDINDIADLNGTLYAIERSTNTLGILDRDTGAYTATVTIQGATVGFFGGLAVDPETGAMYGTLDAASFYRIDPSTGVATSIGAQALATLGLAFGPPVSAR